MALSEIRVNTTKTRTGVGTITYTETGPVITGIATASNFKTGSTNVHSTGVELTNINTGGATATFGGAISGTTASFSGNVSVGGTLTYEDVTNVDAVGLVTARNGIKVLAGGANVVGVVTATSFVGALTGTASGNPTLANGVNNRVITATGANALTGESNLTFDHNQLFINCGNYSYPIVINSTQSSVRAVIRQTNDGNANSGLAIQKRHSTLHPTNHWYGDISFEGWDGSGYHRAGLIECVAVGTPANDNMPGELRFSTNAGAATQTKILTITKDGNLYHTGGGNGRRYSFASDGTAHYMKHDTTLNGIILNGYGGIAFETNGTNERLRIASDGKVYFGDFASVGSKAYILKEVSGDYKFNIFASSSTTTNRIITFNSRSNVEAMRITADGKLGLGTNNPDTFIHAKATGNANVTLTLEQGTTAGNVSGIKVGRTDGSGNIRMTTAVGGGIPVSGVPGIMFGSTETNLPAIGFQTPNSSNGHIVFSPKGTEKLRITSGGDIQLQGGTIYGEDSASATFKLQSTSGNSNHSRIEIGAIQSSDNGGIHFYTAGSSTAERHMTLKGTSGNLGISVDNPDHRLDVSAAEDSYGIRTTGGIRLDNNTSSSKQIATAAGMFYVTATLTSSDETWFTVAKIQYATGSFTCVVGDASSRNVMTGHFMATVPAYGVSFLSKKESSGAWNTGGSDIRFVNDGTYMAIQVKHNSYYNDSNSAGCYLMLVQCY